MHETRLKDNRPFGTLLGDAVTSSIQTLLMIGGFIILFSVINTLLSLTNITDVLATIIKILFVILHLPEAFSLPFISGLFEMTIGSQLISEVKMPSYCNKRLSSVSCLHSVDLVFKHR